MLFGIDKENPIIGYYDSLSLGVFFTVVGYLWLCFVYFFLIRWRSSRKPYWMYFGLFFFFLAISRGFFIVHDFYYTEGEAHLQFWRVATVFGWCAVSMLAGLLAILIFPAVKKEGGEGTGKGGNLLFGRFEKSQVYRILRVVIPILPLVLALVVAVMPAELIATQQEAQAMGITFHPSVVPDYPIGRFGLNYVFLPLITVLVPVAFFSLGYRSVGVIRRSLYLNGAGFLFYYLGRALQSTVDVFFSNPYNLALLPGLFILLGILTIVVANQFEHLK
ncbi:MAG: hypothetical protein ACTSU5_17460 [Promethearchaeota archaeon]